MKWLCSIFLVIAWTSFAYADPKSPSSTAKLEIDLAYYRPIENSVKPDYPSLADACDLSFDHSIVDHIMPPRQLRSSIRFEYKGIQSLIVKQLENRVNSLGRRSLRAQYQETYMTESEFQHAYNQMKYSELVHQGHAWWLDRTWMDYLPPEKGGAPFSPEVRTIGSTHTIYELGPISFNNVGKISVEKFGFFDVQTDRNFSTLESLETPANNGYDENPTNKKAPRRIIDVNIKPNQFEAQKETWYKNRFWKLSLRPGARVRFALDNFQYTGDVSIRFDAEFYYGKLHFADLEFIIKYKPADNELKSNFSFAIITF